MSRTACVVLLALLPLLAGHAAEEGNLGLLPRAHGYHTGTAVLVPLRDLAEWAGAEVTYSKPTIRVQRGDLLLRLEIGRPVARVNERPVPLAVAPAVYGGITCVPLRFVVEALGMTAAYHARGLAGWEDDAELRRTGFVPVIVLQSGERTARVVVHREPPDVVGRVLADLQRGPAGVSDGPYGTAWILSVGRISGNRAQAVGPTFYYADDGGAFSPTECSDSDLLRRNGRWYTQGH